MTGVRLFVRTHVQIQRVSKIVRFSFQSGIFFFSENSAKFCFQFNMTIDNSETKDLLARKILVDREDFRVS